MSRILLYNLIEKGDGVDLNIGLTNLLQDFNNHHSNSLEIDLPTGRITLNKFEYLNTGKVYDSGKVAFLVATKQFNRKHAKRLLLQHACDKIDARKLHLESLKCKYQKLLAA